MTAIRKFNKYRADMAKLHHVSWQFPLPDPLPEELSTLRDDPSLLTDVWVTRVSATSPRWLDDANVRRGIQAVLVRDRCEEERRRLEMEAANMCRSFRLNLAAVELALRLPASTVFYLTYNWLAADILGGQTHRSYSFSSRRRRKFSSSSSTGATL